MTVTDRVVRMRWQGPVSEFLQDPTPEIDLEGALSSGKTTACLWKVFNSLTHPDHSGIFWWVGRYGDGETQTKIKRGFDLGLRLAIPVATDPPEDAAVVRMRQRD